MAIEHFRLFGDASLVVPAREFGGATAARTLGALDAATRAATARDIVAIGAAADGACAAAAAAAAATAAEPDGTEESALAAEQGQRPAEPPRYNATAVSLRPAWPVDGAWAPRYWVTVKARTRVLAHAVPAVYNTIK